MAPDPMNVDGVLVAAIYRAAANHIDRYGEVPAGIRVTPAFYADLCRERSLLAMPRVWGYAITVDPELRQHRGFSFERGIPEAAAGK